MYSGNYCGSLVGAASSVGGRMGEDVVGELSQVQATKGPLCLTKEFGLLQRTGVLREWF